MIIPVGHEETTLRRQPWVTYGLMALCTAVLVATEWHGPEAVYRAWGLTPAAPRAHGYLTHLFVHAGWGHLIANLLILYLAGPPLEDRWGRPFFAAFSLASGLFAAGFYAMLSGSSNVPLVGASGAIAGLMGATLLRFWSARIRFLYYFWNPRPKSGAFSVPVWAMLPLWFITQAVLARVAHATGVAGGVAYACHVGGFAFGAAVAAAVRQWHLEERYFGGQAESAVPAPGNAVIGEAMDLRIQGDAPAALALLRDAVAARPDDPETLNVYWELACELRKVDDAVPQMLKALQQRLAAGDSDEAARCWEALAAGAPAARADRSTLMRLVPVFLDRENPGRATEVLRQIVDPAASPLSTGQAFRVLEMARNVDPVSALVAARRALETPDLPEAKRERIATLAAELEGRSAAVPKAPAAQTEAKVPPVAVAQAPTPPEESASLGIELPDDPAYDFTLPSESDRASEPASGPVSRELDATGSLVSSADAAELLPDDLPPDQWNVESPPPLITPSTGPELGIDPDASNFDLPVPYDEPGEGSRSGSGELPPLASGQLRAEAPPPLPQARALDVALAASASVSRFHGVKVIEAAPLELGDDAVRLKRAEGKSGSVAYSAIQAIAVAAVRGLAAKPVLLIDLAVNWNDAPEDGQLRVIRLRSDAFDVRALMPGSQRSIDGFRALQEQLLARTDAVPLPDLEAARGRPFRTFDDVESYEAEALGVG